MAIVRELLSGQGFASVYPPGIAFWMSILSLVVFLVACASIAYGVRTFQSPVNWVKEFILIAWIIGPPAWFAVDYFVIYKAYGVPGSLEYFKYGQDVASKFWIAVTTLLTGLYLNQELGKFVARVWSRPT